MLKKYLHTRFRVHDMNRSINFYNGILGMDIVERKTSPRGFPGTECHLELCSFPNSGSVKVPEDLVHLAFQVENLKQCMDRLKEARIPITEGPIETQGGTSFIFTEDPDKYEIELMQYSDEQC